MQKHIKGSGLFNEKHLWIRTERNIEIEIAFSKKLIIIIRFLFGSFIPPIFSLREAQQKNCSVIFMHKFAKTEKERKNVSEFIPCDTQKEKQLFLFKSKLCNCEHYTT